MARTWIDVQIHADVDAAELLGVLNGEGACGGWHEPGVIHLYWPAAQWTPEHLTRVQRAVRGLCADVDAPEITTRSIPEEDWNAQWAQSVMPIRIGRRFVVQPSWASLPLQPDDIVLVIDPKQAFGSGHHATTQLLLEWLEDEVRGGERVLDVGTGSGILAMASLRLGASTAVGVDHDPVAIDCAQGYAEANGFGPELMLIAGTVNEVARSWDLLLANLDRRTLFEMATVLPRLAAKEARLLCSGILREDGPMVREVYQAVGARVIGERGREGWLALAFEWP